MVSRTLASLDAWLAEAERVLAEQEHYSQSQSTVRGDDGRAAVQLELFEGQL